MDESKIIEVANKKIIDFANSQPPEVWHQMVMEWNWDSEYNFLNWLIDNYNTDKATILMIYWKSSPSYGFPKKELIERNYMNNFYLNQHFSFNPENDIGENWVAYNPVENIPIPNFMYKKLDGIEIPYPEGFIEGMPENLFYEIEGLYN